MRRRRSRQVRCGRLAAGLLAFALAASPAVARRGHDDLDDRFDDRGRHGRHHEGDFDDHGRRHDGVFGRHHHEGAWWADFRGRGIELEARVVDVDPAARVLILESGDALYVPEDTPFHPDGDLFAFEHVARSAAHGVPIEVEGLAVRDRDGLWIATALKVESER